MTKIYRSKDVALKFEKFYGGGFGIMFVTPNFNIWYNEGTLCFSFAIFFWGIELWAGDVENLV